MIFNEANNAIHEATLCTLCPFLPFVFRVLTIHEFPVVFI
jgi:hypothetical protein